MLTVGLDLASAPPKTAVAAIRWEAGGARLERLQLGVDDDTAVTALASADKAGVDVPFGWPAAFVELVVAHAAGALVASPEPWPAERRAVQFRHTDLWVRERTGRLPLSVSTDKIALPALRWTGLEARLVAAGVRCPRDGSGPVAEVYPAAALSTWGLVSRGYKDDAAVRAALVADLAAACPVVELGEHRALMAASDDAMDAVVCALVARAAALGLTHPAPSEVPAQVEGWIHLPLADSLAALAG
ncbi:DUF429 domain-containing protein [Arsenicicoccus dermatophilus]|uniref:DUF429 domain-containing protein n=1 Tax=Arsenicicoccus dermatophilus TaxID=1076331 RepID=UPI00391719BC